jgi:Tfp pilus assembly protein FimT
LPEFPCIRDLSALYKVFGRLINSEGVITMRQLGNSIGFTLIEALIVAGVMALLVVIAGAAVSRYSLNRKVDSITKTISSTLLIAKLKSARYGVEYQAVITYDDSNKILSIEMQRGDSNRGSTIYKSEISQSLNILGGIKITPKSKAINFNPNGTLGASSGTINIRPTDDANTKRCGKVVVTPFGRIRVLQGNWDGSECSPIREPK